MVHLKGQGGELRSSGRRLATLGDWELYQDGYGLKIGAEVVSYDRYLLPRAEAGDVNLRLGDRTIRHEGLKIDWDGEYLRLKRGE